MTSQEKKEFLQQYRAAEAEERRLEMEIERWQARAAKMTVGYGGTPSGGGDGRSLERAVARIDELIRQLTGQRDRLARLRQEIGAAIGKEPLFGHRSGKKSNTHWACFMKIEGET